MRYNTPMSEPASILVIEDDAAINEVVAVNLRRNGFACTQAFSGSEGRLLLDSGQPFDLVITDLMLPGLAGEDVVRLVRASVDVPVIVMSARTTAADKVALLDLGADDYLARSISTSCWLACRCSCATPRPVARPRPRRLRLPPVRPNRMPRLLCSTKTGRLTSTLAR